MFEMSIFENANVDASNPASPHEKISRKGAKQTSPPPPPFSYVGQGRKDYEVKRPKVGPERLLTLFRDWFTTEMDSVHQPVVTGFESRAPRGWVYAIDDQITSGQRTLSGFQP
jgi:hypothetical protein